MSTRALFSCELHAINKQYQITITYRYVFFLQSCANILLDLPLPMNLYAEETSNLTGVLFRWSLSHKAVSYTLFYCIKKRGNKEECEVHGNL